MSVTSEFPSLALHSLTCSYLSSMLLPASCHCLSFWLVTLLPVPHHWLPFFVISSIFTLKVFHGLFQRQATLLTLKQRARSHKTLIISIRELSGESIVHRKMTVAPQKAHSSVCGLGLSWVLGLPHNASSRNPCWLTVSHRGILPQNTQQLAPAYPVDMA